MKVTWLGAITGASFAEAFLPKTSVKRGDAKIVVNVLESYAEIKYWRQRKH